MAWRHPAGRSVAAAFLAHSALVGTWAARLPAIKHALHLSDGRLGAALFGMAAGTLAGSWLGGRLGRWLGPAPVVRAGVPATAAALVATALAGSFAALAAALVVFGVVAAVVDVAMNAIAVGVERQDGRPLMSGLHGVWSVGLLLGAVAASGAAAAGLRPSVHFAIVAGVVAAGSALPLARLRSGGGAGAPGRRAGRTAWTAAVAALGAIAFCSYFAEGAAIDWSAVYMHDRAGAGGAVAAAAFAGFSLAMAGSRLIGDRLLARFGPVAVTRTASAVAAAGLGVALAIPVPAAGLVGFALMGAGLAPIVPTVISAVGGTVAGVEEAVSRVIMIAYVGTITGPAAIGYTAGRAGLRPALVIPLVLIAGIGLAAGRLRAAAGGGLTRT
jgi:Major Facilitator Superfamily